MNVNMFDGHYEYMGFVIYNGESRHIWDIEPLNWSIQAAERFKSKSPSFRTLAAAKKWIKTDGSGINESEYI
jgi:hypothetical protein